MQLSKPPLHVGSIAYQVSNPPKQNPGKRLALLKPSLAKVTRLVDLVFNVVR
jgi:hypothetical protein